MVIDGKRLLGRLVGDRPRTQGGIAFKGGHQIEAQIPAQRRGGRVGAVGERPGSAAKEGPVKGRGHGKTQRQARHGVVGSVGGDGDDIGLVQHLHHPLALELGIGLVKF